MLQGTLVLIYKNVAAYFIAMLIHLAVCTAAFYYLTGKEFPGIFKFKPVSKERVLDLLKKALPLSAGSLLYTVFYRVDVFFIEKYKGVNAAGEYGLSFSILDQFIYLVFAQFLLVIYPRLITFYNEDRARLRRTLFYFNIIFSGSFAALTVLSAFLAEPMITFIFGERYAYSAILMTYMVPNLCLTGFLHFYSRIMIITSRETAYFIIMALAFALKIILSYIMIAPYGAPGIIASTFIAFLLTIAACIIISNKAVSTRLLE
ncbi:MAG TPA: polysaccharide biosynthesis C-terminal domain-containing protein [Ignavibacteriales bacterium]|nr:polysaccharide biosynthesis C-terminal domain-containing protein [Ignavibacteriales bacterium]